MVAMVILLVGLGGTITLLDQAQRTTSATKAREGAVALSRELVEAARGMQYDQLTQGAVVPNIRAKPGFTSSTFGANGWTIQRRGITYAMAVGVCSVDDPTDGLGSANAGFCADVTGASSSSSCVTALGRDGNIAGTGSATGTQVGDCGLDPDKDGEVDNLSLGQLGSCTSGTCPGGGTADTNPDDYKRVVTLVRWTSGEGSRYVLQSDTLPYPGLSGAPRVTSLTSASGLVISSATQTSASFTAKTNRKAASVAWLLQGTPKGNASGDSAGTTWTFTWQLGTTGCSSGATAPLAGEALDGPYVVGVKAFDSFGQSGAVFAQSVTLNRCQPYAVAGFQAVHIGDQVVMAWFPSSERDIEGYKVFRRQGSGTETLVCDLSNAVACIDATPPTSGTWDYRVYAYDKDSADALRRGQPSTAVSVDLSNHAPNVPAGFKSFPGPLLTWSAASPVDPDAGDSIALYRVYRDGTALTNRYVDVPSGTTYTDTAGALDGPHTYYVAAVDNHGAESVKTAPETQP
jgi:Tfp pilus assembly protein PilV